MMLVLFWKLCMDFKGLLAGWVRSFLWILRARNKVRSALSSL